MIFLFDTLLDVRKTYSSQNCLETEILTNFYVEGDVNQKQWTIHSEKKKHLFLFVKQEHVECSIR